MKAWWENAPREAFTAVSREYFTTVAVTPPKAVRDQLRYNDEYEAVRECKLVGMRVRVFR